MIDLNTLIPRDSNLQLVAGLNINDRGEIVGDGVPSGFPLNTDLFGHLFVLIPCDESHPNIQGCDYKPVDATGLVDGVPSNTAEGNTNMTPTEINGRIRAILSLRNRRFRSLQPR
jgi:hypothetical protein